jgi:FAD:protein FMN transferase
MPNFQILKLNLIALFKFSHFMPTIYRNLFAMGTRFELVLPGIGEDTGDFIFGLVGKEIRRLHELLNNYSDSSALSILNKTAFDSPYFSTKELFDIISTLKEMHSASLGYFDASVQSIKATNISHSGMRDIITNSVDRSVCFANKGITISSGGFGKGFALENVKNILLDHNILQAFISFGESSVLALGDHPHGEGWKVSIPDIYSSESVYVFHLKNNALSVSGNTPSNRIKYPEGHIINPLTGISEKKNGLVCVSGPSAFVAEILSTALFLADISDQSLILNNFPEYKAVRISYFADSKTPEIVEIELK